MVQYCWIRGTVPAFRRDRSTSECLVSSYHTRRISGRRQCHSFLKADWAEAIRCPLCHSFAFSRRSYCRGQDFPEARFIYLPRAYDAVRSLGSIAAVKAGFLAGLLPDDFTQRSLPVNDGAKQWTEIAESTGIQPPDGFPWQEGYDIFGDGSLLGVDVSGHAEGMMGLLLRTEKHDYFCVQMPYGRAGLSVNSADLMHWQALLCQIGRSIDRTLTSWFTCTNSSLRFASCRVIAKKR